MQRTGKICMAVLFSLMWSSAFIAGKVGVAYCPPLLLLSLRFLVAGPILLTIARCLGHSVRLCKEEVFWMVVLGVLNYTLYLGLSFTSLKSIPSGIVVVIISTAPFYTAAIARWLLHEKQNLMTLFGLIIGFCGVLAIMMHSFCGADMNGTGLVLALLAAVSFSAGTVLFKKAPLASVSLFATVGYQTLVGGVSLLVLGLLLEDPGKIHLTLPFAASLAYLVVVVSVGATLLWFSLVRSSTASSASSLHYLNPVFGIGLAWLFLGEPLSMPDALGTLLVILGIAAITRSTTVSR